MQLLRGVMTWTWGNYVTSERCDDLDRGNFVTSEMCDDLDSGNYVTSEMCMAWHMAHGTWQIAHCTASLFTNFQVQESPRVKVLGVHQPHTGGHPASASPGLQFSIFLQYILVMPCHAFCVHKRPWHDTGQRNWAIAMVSALPCAMPFVNTKGHGMAHGTWHMAKGIGPLQ